MPLLHGPVTTCLVSSDGPLGEQAAEHLPGTSRATRWLPTTERRPSK